MNDITMKCTFLLAVLIGLSLGACSAHDSEKVVYNGIPWFDEQGNIVTWCMHCGRWWAVLFVRRI